MAGAKCTGAAGAVVIDLATRKVLQQPSLDHDTCRLLTDLLVLWHAGELRGLAVCADVNGAESRLTSGRYARGLVAAANAAARMHIGLLSLPDERE